MNIVVSLLLVMVQGVSITVLYISSAGVLLMFCSEA